MARATNRLSARRVQTLTERGRHADGGGLYLVVDEAGAKRWVLLYRLDGRRREMGLGSALDLTGWLWTGLIERISQDRRSWT